MNLQKVVCPVCLIVASVCLVFTRPAHAAAPAASKPNILFIMSDDHTWQALGCYNSRFRTLDPTPTLDKLAAEGMVFDSALCTNSICTPSRACIMTGQYSHDYQYWMHMAHHDVPAHIAMRTKRYKLIQFYGTAGTEGFGSQRSEYATPPAWELYDLHCDPHEMDNLYDDPAHADLVENLKARFRDLRRRIRADDPSVGIDKARRARIAACNAVIEEFWDYSEEDRRKAVEISHDYFKRFGDPDTCQKYKPPRQRLDRLDPSEK